MARIEKFQVVYQWVTYEFEPREDGGYTVTVPVAPACGSSGESFEEALEGARETLVLWVRQALRSGLAVADELLPVADRLMDEGERQYQEGG
ncbi:MAG: type II toxin-antitoxin system HicB family antitoxin [Chloroflexi bacterium]|nr:type II toxin-antitoxin system HicB family antitoxin [Chloroflexota bacterium]